MPFSLSSAIRCPYRGGVSPNCRATHLCLLLVHLTSPRIVTPFAFTSDGPSRSWSIQKGINISIVNVTWSSSSAKSLQQCDKHRHHRTQPVPIFCILRVCTCEQLQLKHEVALQRCILTQAFLQGSTCLEQRIIQHLRTCPLCDCVHEWRCRECEVKMSESSSPIIDPQSTRQMCANEQWKPNIHKSPKNAKDHCSLELKRFQPLGTASLRHDTSFPFLFRGPRQCNRRFRDTRVYSVQLKHTKTKFHSFPARPLNLPVSPGVPAQAVAMNFKAAARMAKDRGGRYLAGCSGWCRRKALGDCE